MLPWSDWVVPSPRRLGDEGEAASLHRSVSTTRTMLSKKTARMGDKAKAVRRVSDRRRLCCLSGHPDASIAPSAGAVPVSKKEGSPLATPK